MERVKTIKELKELLRDTAESCEYNANKFGEANMNQSSIGCQGMASAYNYVLDLLINSNELLDANTFVNQIQNDTYNKLRESQSDAQCRRILKELIIKP